MEKIKALIFFVLALSLIGSASAFACGDDEHATKNGHEFNLVSSAQASSDIKKATFQVDKMMCSGCQKKVEAKLKSIDGFQSVTFKKKQAEVTYLASKTNENALLSAINESFH